MFTASVIVPYSLSVKNEEGDVENPWPLVERRNWRCFETKAIVFWLKLRLVIKFVVPNQIKTLVREQSRVHFSKQTCILPRI